MDQQQLAEVERGNARMTVKLGKADLIINAPKRLLQVLGLPEPELPETDEPK